MYLFFLTALQIAWHYKFITSLRIYLSIHEYTRCDNDNVLQQRLYATLLLIFVLCLDVCVKKMFEFKINPSQECKSWFSSVHLTSIETCEWLKKKIKLKILHIIWILYRIKSIENLLKSAWKTCWTVNNLQCESA